MGGIVYWTYFLAIVCVETIATGNSDLKLSTPEECRRQCTVDGPSLVCYYQFIIELMTTMGPTCDECQKNQNFTLEPNNCDCILADGVEKTVLTINRSVPGPSINTCLGDVVIADVHNAAVGTQTTIHWHGVYQKDFQYYDGVPFITQCPILSSNTFRYQFQVNNAGTHFYHSHEALQMMDGMYGALIVRDPNDANLDEYDEDLPEHVMLLSDWMHELAIVHFPGTYRNDPGQVPDNLLINGYGKRTDPQSGIETNTPLFQFEVESGKVYRFRMINGFSSVCLADINIEKHGMTIIAQDGRDVKPKLVDIITSASGERVDFTINANKPVGCYWIQLRGLGSCAAKKLQQFGILKYKGAECQSPSDAKPAYDDVGSSGAIVYNSITATSCEREEESNEVCVNQLDSKVPSDMTYGEGYYRLELGFGFYRYNITDHLQRHMVTDSRHVLTSVINNESFVEPSAPLISQREGYEKLCKPQQYSTCTEPCICTNVVHVPLNSTVDIMLWDTEGSANMHHTFHMHGYSFQVRGIKVFGRGSTTKEDRKMFWQEYEKNDERNLYKNAPKKDTVKVPAFGAVIIRVFTDNPGWWFFHCHFLWHTMTGMDIVLHVGDNSDLPPVPSHFPKCYNWQPDVYV